MQPDQAKFAIRVLWGSFDISGNWLPNPNLSMSAAEQFRQNVLIDPQRMRRHMPMQSQK